jgi:hypothetical protein
MKGQNTKSIKRQFTNSSRTGVTSLRSVKFYHQASSGSTVIDLTSLTTPSGYTNPSPSLLSSAQLKYFPENFLLVSSLKGVLIENMSYTILNNTSIKLTDGAEDGEIFSGVFHNVGTSGKVIADVRTPNGSGELLENQTDFNLGEAIPISELTSQWPIQVFRSGVPMLRNDGNAAYTGDDSIGNYQMLDNGSGYCQTIRFNIVGDAGNEPISWANHGALGERPNVSVLQAVDKISSQFEVMLQDLAVLTEEPESKYRDTVPANADLKSFGDLVFLLNQAASVAFSFKQYCQQVFNPASMTTTTGTLRFGTITFTGASLLTYTDANGRFTNNTNRDIEVHVSFGARSNVQMNVQVTKNGTVVMGINTPGASLWGQVTAKFVLSPTQYLELVVDQTLTSGVNQYLNIAAESVKSYLLEQ